MKVQMMLEREEEDANVDALVGSALGALDVVEINFYISTLSTTLATTPAITPPYASFIVHDLIPEHAGQMLDRLSCRCGLVLVGRSSVLFCRGLSSYTMTKASHEERTAGEPREPDLHYVWLQSISQANASVRMLKLRKHHPHRPITACAPHSAPIFQAHSEMQQYSSCQVSG